MPLSAAIGPYDVIRLINRGGQGSVYLGYDKRLQRRVAIKVHRLPADKAGGKRLLCEAQLIASIASPKVVQIYDLVLGQDHLALIMEYVPGCDLEEFLGDARPSVASVLTVATDLAGSLAAARQQQIVHGDLKARNVLVTNSGRVKLTDFGIARSSREHAPGLQWAGSPSCVSPEQYLGKALDVRSDLFALGCLLYRMLTGSQPFMREGQLDPRHLLEEMPPAVEDLAGPLPPGLSALVNGLLQKDPDNRPRDTQQVRYALRNIAKTIPLSISSTLLGESRPSFREESPGDLPPLIPQDLRRGGRSALRPFQLDQLSSWRGLLSRFTPLAIGATVLGSLGLLWFLLDQIFPGETRIHIEPPMMRVASDIKLPSGVSSSWLIDQVEEAASSRIGPIKITGPVGDARARTLWASPPSPEAPERLTVALRCSGNWCLFALNREGSGGSASEQAVLDPDMTVAHWGRVIQGATRALYD